MIRLKQRLQNEAGETYFVLLSADSDEEDEQPLYGRVLVFLRMRGIDV